MTRQRGNWVENGGSAMDMAIGRTGSKEGVGAPAQPPGRELVLLVSDPPVVDHLAQTALHPGHHQEQGLAVQCHCGGVAELRKEVLLKPIFCQATLRNTGVFSGLQL